MFERGCLVAVTIAAVLLLLSVGRLGNSLNSTILQIKTDTHTEALKLDATLTDLDRDTVIASGTLTSMEKASRSWQTKQNQLADQGLAATRNLNADLLAANTLLSQGSLLLESQTKSLSDLESGVGQSAISVAQRIADLASQAQPVLNNASAASQSLNTAILETSPHILATSEHLDAVTLDGKKLADNYTDKILNPHRTPWEKFEAGLRIVGLGVRAYLAY